MTQDAHPVGYMEKILVADCETSGMAFNSDDPSIDSVTGQTFQSVSWGFVVADATTFQPIEKLYLEIQWDGVSKWEPKAQAVHGLALEYLEANGMSEEDAVVAIASLILKYWGPDGSVSLGGHNVATFDLHFLRRLMRSQGIEIKFAHRHVDTSSIGLATFGTFTSDGLFEAVGIEARGKHNALDDAEHSLRAMRVVKQLFNACLEGA